MTDQQIEGTAQNAPISRDRQTIERGLVRQEDVAGAGTGAGAGACLQPKLPLMLVVAIVIVTATVECIVKHSHKSAMATQLRVNSSVIFAFFSPLNLGVYA